MARDSRERRAAFEIAAESVSLGLGVVVVGDLGSGRTRFVRDLVARASAPMRERLWVGDEIDQLTHGQAEKLARAVESGRIVPVATASLRSPLPQDIARLCHEGVMMRLELPPLTSVEMLAAVEDGLGGPLEIRSVPSFVPRRPGGDLVILCESARQARAGSALQRRDGFWKLTAALRPEGSLRELIHSRHSPAGTLDETSELILDVLGLAPEVSLATAYEIFEIDSTDLSLEKLESAGLIDVLSADGEVRLRIRDSAVELVLPHTIGSLRRNRLSRRIVEVLDARSPESLSASELASLAHLALPLGHVVSPRILIRRAVAALEASRVELALHLATAALTHGGGAAAEMVLAAAESQLGWSEPALKRLLAIQAQPADDIDRPQLEALLTLVRSRIGDPAFGWHLPSAPPMDTSGYLNALVRVEAGAHAPGRSSEDDVDRAQAVLEGERLAQQATMATFDGHFALATEYLDAGERILAGVGADLFMITLRRGYVDAISGHLTRALQLAEALRDEAASDGKADQYALASWMSGQFLLYSGRGTAAVEALDDALEVAIRIGMDRAGYLIRPELAIALSISGDLRAAAEILEVSEEAPSDGFGGATLVQQASGWIQAWSGHLDDARISFLEAAVIHIGRGHRPGSIRAYSEAARAGGAIEVLAHISELSADSSSPLVEQFHRQVCALAALESSRMADEPVPSEHLAEEFDAIGANMDALDLHLESAEAFAYAAMLHELAGRSRSAAAAGRRSAEQFAICGVTTSPFLSRGTPRGSAVLSARERDIAGRAADGESNREIAEALVLSVRTVETHLQRVYRKLGVRTRAELGAALPSIAVGDTGSSPTAID